MPPITLHLDLPEPLAEEAKEAGLLRSEAIERLLRAELARRQLDEVWRRVECMRRGGGSDDVTPDELDVELETVRRQRRS